MSVSAFLKLVEIRTKIASLTPFILGNLFLIYHFQNFNFANFILMFISLIFVDMGTTAVNNYQDYLKAEKKAGYNYEEHNAIVNYSISIKTVRRTIFLLFLTAISSGIILYLRTDLIVLLIGIISFLVGIIYTSGPIPISRTPFGEIFSGFFMGFFITFLSIYIHNLNLIEIIFDSQILKIEIIYSDIIRIFLFSLPLILGIANIMLANNICDIEDDLENNRYTLPIYISRKSSLKLFKYLYYLSYLTIILSIIFNILPLYSLLSLFSLILIQKNISSFEKKQSKKETFVLAVKNFIILNYSTAFTILLAFIFN